MNWFLVIGILIIFYFLFSKRSGANENNAIEVIKGYLSGVGKDLKIGQKFIIDNTYPLFVIQKDINNKDKIAGIPYSNIRPIEIEVKDKKDWVTNQGSKYIIYGFSCDYLEPFYPGWYGLGQLIYFTLTKTDLSLQ